MFLSSKIRGRGGGREIRETRPTLSSAREREIEELRKKRDCVSSRLPLYTVCRLQLEIMPRKVL